MLSRISLISKNSNKAKQILLRSAASTNLNNKSHSNKLINTLTLRVMSTHNDKQNPNEEDDYNLDEVVQEKASKMLRRETREGSSNDKSSDLAALREQVAEANENLESESDLEMLSDDYISDLEYTNPMLTRTEEEMMAELTKEELEELQEFKEEKEMEDVTVQDLKEIPSFQLQNDLLELVREKIGTNDREKARTFLNKLNKLAQDANVLIDRSTMLKIELLLKKKQELDDKVLLETQQKLEQQIGTKVVPSSYEFESPQYKPLRTDDDTTKKQALNWDDYENSVLNMIAKKTNEETLDLQKMDFTDLIGNDMLTNIEEENLNQIDKEYLQRETEYFQDQQLEEFREEQLDVQMNRLSELTSSFQDKFNEIKYSQSLRDQTNRELPVVQQEDLEHGFKSDKLNMQELEQQMRMMEDEAGYQMMVNNEGELRNQYDQIENLVQINFNLRNKLIQSTKIARQLLANSLKSRDTLMRRLEQMSKDHVSDTMPSKLYDFVAQEKLIQKIKQTTQNLHKERKFDINSLDIQNYNAELLYHVKVAALNQDFNNPQYAKHMEKVIAQMEKNNVQPDQHTLARLFEYGVLAKNNNFANKKMKEILDQDYQDPLVQVHKSLLKQFYHQSLRTDNFDGLGFLAAYLRLKNIDIKNWDLNKFKPSLDFYLNKSFNLQNVLIFTNFYSYHFECRFQSELKNLEKPLNELSESEKYALNKEVFKNAHNLVDMRSLFNFLVQKVGGKDTVDPVTKQDLMWNLVDFFTSKGKQDIIKKSENLNHIIDDSDIALYFKNHFNSSKTFERVTQVILRTNDTPSNSFHNLILQYLREYQTKNSQLPFSFDQLKTRNAYIKIRQASKTQKVKLNEKTLEYFLYLFKCQEMWPEIIDLCENFNTFTQQDSKHSEIKNYYLSEALLRIPAEQHYHKIIGEAVYDNQELTTPGYITAMTKAYFKDGSKSHAIKFFQDSITEMREVKEKREKILTSLFDSVYSEKNPRDLSYEQFKQKYLNMFVYSNQILKESFAITQLRRVVQDKNYDEIESLFQLYLVEKEENQMLQNLENYTPSEFQWLKEDAQVDEIQGLDENDRNQLSMLRERKQALQSKIGEADVKKMLELMEVMKDDKIKYMKNMSTRSADELQKIFNIMNKEQVEQILERTQPVYQAARDMMERDENSGVLAALEENHEALAEQMLHENLEGMFEDREMPNRGLAKSIERVYDRKRPLRGDQSFKHTMDVATFNQYLLDGDIVEDEDPLNIYEKAHNRTLLDMQEELLDAVNKRRSKVLSLTLEIFNKVQDQSLKVTKLNTVENLEEGFVQIDEINENLAKFEALFNDERSPILSALSTIAQYKGDDNLIDFDDFFQDFGDYGTKEFDLQGFKKENELLNSLNDQVQQNIQNLRDIQGQILKESSDKEKISGRSYKQIYENSYQRWDANKKEQFESQLEQRIKNLYKEYKESLEKNKDAVKAEELPEEDKLHLLRDIFTVEYNDQFTHNLFPEFYSQDLIIFGIENNIPEAVRLGEKMMSDNGHVLSQDLQSVVKEYLLGNHDKYLESMKSTGPIDNTTLYRRVRNVDQNGNESAPAIFSYDDPYWQDFFQKNQRKTQLWKHPSILAWEHKQYGIVGEIIDMKKIERVQKQLQQAKYM